MTLSVRNKLLLVIATSTAGFFALLLASLYLSTLVNREIERMEAEYLPKVELGPSFERRFDELSRGFQDAVAAREPEMLEENRARRDRFLAELREARDVLDAGMVDALRLAVEDWYATADSVSARLVAGETGEALVEAMVSMQTKQKTARAHLEAATRFDRGQLTASIERVRNAQQRSFRVRLVIILICLAALAVLAVRIIGDLLRSVDELSRGLARFAAGELDKPIEVTSRDELAIVAQHANNMAESLRRSVAELEAFNYSVSHDLRAPLRPLDGFSQALIEDYGHQLDPKAVDYLQRIRAAAQRMSQLIDDMLQLSRLGRAELNSRACDLVPIAEAVIAELRRADPARQVAWVTVPEARAEGDPRLLRIVLENLLRNAWKFSRNVPNARIELGVKDEGDRRVYFVRDNGAGFNPAFAHKLFQPFQRLHIPRDFEGTGIGLAIVQRIIRRHDGKVWAESTPGNGATFYFTLHDGPPTWRGAPLTNGSVEQGKASP